MTKLWLTITVLFVVAFAAGVAVALSVRQWENPPTGRGSWMVRELNLTHDQQEALSKIWSEVGNSNWRDEGDRRREVQRQRDEAIRKLVPEERQADLEKILADYSKQMADLTAQRRQAFDRAVEKTKSILTDEQRKKYEELLSRRAENRRSNGSGSSEGRGWGHSNSTTAPATQPAGGE